MAESITYGLIMNEQETALYANMSRGILEDAQERMELKGDIGPLGKHHVRLEIDLEPVGRRRNPDYREEDIKHVLRTMAEIEATAMTMIDGDRLLSFWIGANHADDGRIFMGGSVAQPAMPDRLVSAFVTGHMRQTARVIRYLRELNRTGRAYQEHLNDSVYGSYIKERGVSLQTNPIGSCSVDTDGMEYDPEDSHYDLHSHNLYTPEQQLICFTGMVTLAFCAAASLPDPA